jgi:hypothetical protein
MKRRQKQMSSNKPEILEEDEYSEDYYDYEDQEYTVCAEGFSVDEDCDPKTRYGIEYCEFCCPWRLLDTPVENNPVEEQVKP